MHCDYIKKGNLIALVENLLLARLSISYGSFPFISFIIYFCIFYAIKSLKQDIISEMHGCLLCPSPCTQWWIEWCEFSYWFVWQIYQLGTYPCGIELSWYHYWLQAQSCNKISICKMRLKCFSNFIIYKRKKNLFDFNKKFSSLHVLKRLQVQFKCQLIVNCNKTTSVISI